MRTKQAREKHILKHLRSLGIQDGISRFQYEVCVYILSVMQEYEDQIC